MDLKNVTTAMVLMASACLAAVADVNRRMEARSARTTKMFSAWDTVDVLMPESAVAAKSSQINPVQLPVSPALRTGAAIFLETVLPLPLRLRFH